MTRRKGELSPAMVDRGWPHQIALPADRVAGNTATIHAFCHNLSLCPRGHSVRYQHRDYVVFCFADPAHAERFCAHFDGEPFDPRDRGRGTRWNQWRKR